MDQITPKNQPGQDKNIFKNQPSSNRLFYILAAVAVVVILLAGAFIWYNQEPKGDITNFVNNFKIVK